MFKVSVKTLAYALCNSCPITVLYFAHQPSVRDVLQRLDHDPVGIKVLYWGGDQMALDDIVIDGAMLTITTAAAQAERTKQEQREAKLMAAREAAGETAEASWQATRQPGQTLLRTMVFLPGTPIAAWDD